MRYLPYFLHYHVYQTSLNVKIAQVLSANQIGEALMHKSIFVSCNLTLGLARGVFEPTDFL